MRSERCNCAGGGYCGICAGAFLALRLRMGLQDDLSFRGHQGVLGKMDRKPGCWTSTEEAAGGEFESFTVKIFWRFWSAASHKTMHKLKEEDEKGEWHSMEEHKVVELCIILRKQEPKAATTSPSDVAWKQWQWIWPPDSKIWRSRSNGNSVPSQTSHVLIPPNAQESRAWAEHLNVHGCLQGDEAASEDTRADSKASQSYNMLHHAAPMAVLSQCVSFRVGFISPYVAYVCLLNHRAVMYGQLQMHMMHFQQTSISTAPFLTSLTLTSRLAEMGVTLSLWKWNSLKRAESSCSLAEVHGTVGQTCACTWCAGRMWRTCMSKYKHEMIHSIIRFGLASFESGGTRDVQKLWNQMNLPLEKCVPFLQNDTGRAHLCGCILHSAWSGGMRYHNGPLLEIPKAARLQ